MEAIIRRVDAMKACAEEQVGILEAILGDPSIITGPSGCTQLQSRVQRDQSDQSDELDDLRKQLQEAMQDADTFLVTQLEEAKATIKAREAQMDRAGVNYLWDPAMPGFKEKAFETATNKLAEANAENEIAQQLDTSTAATRGEKYLMEKRIDDALNAVTEWTKNLRETDEHIAMMAEKLKGFWEENGPRMEAAMALTLSYLPETKVIDAEDYAVTTARDVAGDNEAALLDEYVRIHGDELLRIHEVENRSAEFRKRMVVRAGVKLKELEKQEKKREQEEAKEKYKADEVAEKKRVDAEKREMWAAKARVASAGETTPLAQPTTVKSIEAAVKEQREARLREEAASKQSHQPPPRLNMVEMLAMAKKLKTVTPTISGGALSDDSTRRLLLYENSENQSKAQEERSLALEAMGNRIISIPILKVLRFGVDWRKHPSVLAKEFIGLENTDTVEVLALMSILPGRGAIQAPGKKEIVERFWDYVEIYVPGFPEQKGQPQETRSDTYLNYALPPVGPYPQTAVYKIQEAVKAPASAEEEAIARAAEKRALFREPAGSESEDVAETVETVELVEPKIELTGEMKEALAAVRDERTKLKLKQQVPSPDLCQRSIRGEGITQQIAESKVKRAGAKEYCSKVVEAMEKGVLMEDYENETGEFRGGYRGASFGMSWMR